jgi:hypothetical protein
LPINPAGLISCASLAWQPVLYLPTKSCDQPLIVKVFF